MSANIAVVNGMNSVFTAGDPAWHRLGVNVSQAQSWEQAIRLANLDWQIHKEQLHSLAGDPVDAYGLFRSNDGVFLHACGSKYTPIQNKDAFSVVDSLLAADEQVRYVSAGALGKGETIWCLAQVPGTLRIKGTDDTTKPYLLFAEHRDGRSALVKQTATRVVCQNTLNIALRDGEKVFKLRHTAGVHDRIETAKQLLQNVQGEFRTLEEKMNILARRKMNAASFQQVLRRLFPEIDKSVRSQNVARDILLRYESNDGDAFPSERGTAFNFLNAITGYYDHDRTVRANGDRQEIVLQTKRAEQAMFGASDKMKSDALDWILSATESNATIPEKVIVDMAKKSSSVNNILDQVAV